MLCFLPWGGTSNMILGIGSDWFWSVFVQIQVEWGGGLSQSSYWSTSILALSSIGTGYLCEQDCCGNARSVGRTGWCYAHSCSGMEQATWIPSSSTILGTRHTAAPATRHLPDTRFEVSAKQLFQPSRLQRRPYSFVHWSDLWQHRHFDGKCWVVSHWSWVEMADTCISALSSVLGIGVNKIASHPLARHCSSTKKCVRCFAHCCSKSKHAMWFIPGSSRIPASSQESKNLPDKSFEASATLQLFQSSMNQKRQSAWISLCNWALWSSAHRSLVDTCHAAHSTGDECILDCCTNATSIGKTGAIPSNSNTSGSNHTTGPATRRTSSSHKTWTFCPLPAFSAIELAKETLFICSLIWPLATLGSVTRKVGLSRWLVDTFISALSLLLGSRVYSICDMCMYHIVYTGLGHHFPINWQKQDIEQVQAFGLWGWQNVFDAFLILARNRNTLCDSSLVAPGFLASAGTKNLSDTLFEASATLQLFQPTLLRRDCSLIWFSARIDVLREWLCDRGHWLGPACVCAVLGIAVCNKKKIAAGMPQQSAKLATHQGKCLLFQHGIKCSLPLLFLLPICTSIVMPGNSRIRRRRHTAASTATNFPDTAWQSFFQANWTPTFRSHHCAKNTVHSSDLWPV